MSDIKLQLEGEAARLRALWEKLDHHRHTGLPIDSEEAATEMEGDEVVEKLLHKTEADLEGIQVALARVAAGTYGRCAVCGDDIDPRRLKAMPATDRCTNCAD